MASGTRLLTAWRNLYLVNALVSDALNRRLMAEAGCTLSEHDLLAWLSAAPRRRMRMLDLARALRLSPGGLTRFADRLTRRGWIRRETPDTNRREVYAILTDDGATVFTVARSCYMRALRDALARSLNDDEIDVLASVAGKLVERLTEPQQPTAASGRGMARARVPV